MRIESKLDQQLTIEDRQDTHLRQAKCSDAENQQNIQVESIRSLRELIRKNVVFTDGTFSYRVHWVQPIGDVCDIGILIDEKFHTNTVLKTDRVYTAEIFSTIYDLTIHSIEVESK